MKKFVMMMLILLLALFMSMIVVDNGQVAIAKYRNKTFVYNQGVHLVIPFIETVDYVYLNEYNTQLSVGLPDVKIRLMISYHVTNPVKYNEMINQKHDFSERLFNKITNELSAKIKTVGVAELNQSGFQYSKDVSDLGIFIDKVSLINMTWVKTK